MGNLLHCHMGEQGTQQLGEDAHVFQQDLSVVLGLGFEQDLNGAGEAVHEGGSVGFGVFEG
ncbi:TPA: hypothetical protein ACIRVE_001207 [Pseudomonas putida]|uniref:hypothetical protein n=1 Tax=Pseudomonas sp. TaxID=306 RepID=UPI0028A9DA47|nr:hypothetical protein [Pseudomonas sp.]